MTVYLSLGVFSGPLQVMDICSLLSKPGSRVTAHDRWRTVGGPGLPLLQEGELKE